MRVTSLSSERVFMLDTTSQALAGRSDLLKNLGVN